MSNVHGFWAARATPPDGQTWPLIVFLEASPHPLPLGVSRDGG